MEFRRRDVLKASVAGLAGLAAGAIVTLPRLAAAEGAGTIKIGTICDLSGPLQPFGTQKLQCIQLAVEQINAAGGLLKRKVELVSYDAQSNNQLFAQYAQQLALKDKVVVVHAGLQSSSREVIRPIFRRSNTLYFYNTPYEGGVCDGNTFNTGTTPGQLLANLLPYMIKQVRQEDLRAGGRLQFRPAFGEMDAQDRQGERRRGRSPASSSRSTSTSSVRPSARSSRPSQASSSTPSSVRPTPRSTANGRERA